MLRMMVVVAAVMSTSGVDALDVQRKCLSVVCDTVRFDCPGGREPKPRTEWDTCCFNAETDCREEDASKFVMPFNDDGTHPGFQGYAAHMFLYGAKTVYVRNSRFLRSGVLAHGRWMYSRARHIPGDWYRHSSPKLVTMNTADSNLADFAFPSAQHGWNMGSLDNCILSMDVYVSNITYVPTAVILHQRRRQRGIVVNDFAPAGGWTIGWNHIRTKIAPDQIEQALIPWSRLTHLTILRSGPPNVGSDSCYIKFRNMAVLKQMPAGSADLRRHEPQPSRSLLNGAVFGGEGAVSVRTPLTGSSDQTFTVEAVVTLSRQQHGSLINIPNNLHMDVSQSGQIQLQRTLHRTWTSWPRHPFCQVPCTIALPNCNYSCVKCNEWDEREVQTEENGINMTSLSKTPWRAGDHGCHENGTITSVSRSPSMNSGPFVLRVGIPTLVSVTYDRPTMILYFNGTEVSRMSDGQRVSKADPWSWEQHQTSVGGTVTKGLDDVRDGHVLHEGRAPRHLHQREGRHHYSILLQTDSQDVARTRMYEGVDRNDRKADSITPGVDRMPTMGSTSSAAGMSTSSTTGVERMPTMGSTSSAAEMITSSTTGGGRMPTMGSTSSAAEMITSSTTGVERMPTMGIASSTAQMATDSSPSPPTGPSSAVHNSVHAIIGQVTVTRSAKSGNDVANSALNFAASLEKFYRGSNEGLAFSSATLSSVVGSHPRVYGSNPSLVLLSGYKSGCPKNCNEPKGICWQGQCVCNAFFSGPDCSQEVCTDDCSNNGNCIKGKCVCNKGWHGQKCEIKQCEEQCYVHGVCAKDGNCVCDPNYSGKNCEIGKCPNDCSNHGDCEPGVCSGACKCEPGWMGPDCAESVCPAGCTQNGLCDAKSRKCTCNKGWIGRKCDFPVGPKTVCHHDCYNHGSCDSPSHTCSCNAGYLPPYCKEKRCPSDCSGHGSCNEGNCTCDKFWGSKEDCSVKIFCPNQCTGRYQGTCNTDNGVCECKVGYSGDDCSKDACPRAPVNNQRCNGMHGTCTHTGCKCEKTWTGVDCSERTNLPVKCVHVCGVDMNPFSPATCKTKCHKWRKDEPQWQ